MTKNIQKPSRANRLPIMAIVVVLLAGWMFGATLLAYAALAVLSVLLISQYLSSRWIEGVMLDRQLVANQIETGQSVTIGIVIRNASRWFIPWLLIEDVLSRRSTHRPPKALIVNGNPIRLCMLRSGQQRLLSYSITAVRRGYYQIGPTVSETGDLLGLYRRYRVGTETELFIGLTETDSAGRLRRWLASSNR